jgi:hypothetical protein
MIINLEDRKVTIRQVNRASVEGVVLARTEYKMRVALKDAGDAAVFVCVDGTWLSEDCEPVEIAFEWRRHERKEPFTEADYICPKELAARLIRAIAAADEDERGVPPS